MECRNRFRTMRLFGVLLAFAIWSVACAEKKVETPKGKNTSTPAGGEVQECDEGMVWDEDSKSCVPDDGGTTTTAGTSFNLCKAMLADATLKAAPFNTFVDRLCTQNFLTDLRKSTYVYSGSGDAPVAAEGKQNGNDSEMKLYTSIRTALKPKGYYDLMHLQIFEPDKFKTQGYEYDDAVTYAVKEKKSETELLYHYENTSEAGAPVKYDAVSKFITLKADVAYVVTTQRQAAPSTDATVKDLKGLVLINKSGEQTEVISASDQVYENNGSHDDTFKKAKIAFGQEEKRSWNNAEKAAAGN